VIVEQSGNRAIRTTLGQSGDPRVARTRAGLLDAVRSLAEAGDELSVSAIARTAGVSRASFYAHYASLDDLASTLRREAFHAIGHLYDVDAQSAPDAMRLSQQRLVKHFADHRALYLAVAALPASRESYLADVRAMAAIIEPELQRNPRRPPALQVGASARYIAGAAYGLLDAWISGEVDLTEPELVEHLLQLMPPWFSGLC
jgi:AcrR family transcriptional regulator